jgi:hypothetical protein
METSVISIFSSMRKICCLNMNAKETWMPEPAIDFLYISHFAMMSLILSSGHMLRSVMYSVHMSVSARIAIYVLLGPHIETRHEWPRPNRA